MRKLAAIALAGMMALSLAACSGSPAETTAANTETTAAEGAGTAEGAEAGSETAEATGRLKAIKDAGVLKVATSPDYPPYEFEDLTKQGQEKYVGSDMAFARHLAEQLGVELQIEAMAFDACIAAVGEGRVDIAICGMVPDEDRKNSMDFSDEYYNSGNQVVLVLAENAEQYTSLDDFAGQSVAAQNGSLQYKLVTEQIPDANVEIITAVTDGIMMLKTGKVTGIALASVTADNYIANNTDIAKAAEFDYSENGIVVGVVKNEPELLAEINSIITDVKDSGIYLQWMEEAGQLSSELQSN